MPLPFFLFVLWAVWPLATFPGGKLFAPLVFLIGMFGLRALNLRALPQPIVTIGFFLAWLCLSALWSPAGAGLFEGSLIEGNFAVEAAYLRFVLTATGCLLFVKVLLTAAERRILPAQGWVCAGIGAQLVVVGIVAFKYDAFMLSPGEPMVPSAQSMGRNLNMLVMALPVLIGFVVLQFKPQRALGVSLVVGTATLVFAFMIDGMAVMLALVFGFICFGILHWQREGGFRTLFNLVAAGITLSPLAAWLIARLLPQEASFLPLSTAQRISIWQATVEKIAEAPLFGHGVNAASSWTETYASRPDLLARLAPELADKRIILYHPHNMSLQLWAETGLVGVGLVVLTLVLLGRALPAPGQLHLGVRIGAAGLIGATLAYFTVSYSVWDESFWASLAVVFSGLVVLMRRAKA